MSTFLALAQKTRQNCRESGSGPSAVAGQTGLLKNVVDWVADAYGDIQIRHDNWRWMRSPFSIAATAEDGSYAYSDATDTRLSAAISRFARWWLRDDDGYSCITAYLTSTGVSGEFPLMPLEWSDFRYLYRRGTQTSSTPIHVSVDPQENLVLGPVPSAAHTIIGEYQMGPQILASDADEPEMPSRFHDLVMHRAIEKYGANYVRPEQYNRAVVEGGRMMRALERSQLPGIRLAGPMA